MTTKTIEKPQVEAPKVIKELYFGAVKVAAIAVVSNVRKHFDAKKHAELVGNVRLVGILEPIILRPDAKKVKGKPAAIKPR